jgi:alkylhydroperoxidase family enzyme
MMSRIDYTQSNYPVRKDLLEAHQTLLDSFTHCGTWWDGAERLAISNEARAAHGCGLCAERKAALSPFSIDGTHAGPGELAPEIVDVIHRIVTDPGRLARSWYDRVMAEGTLSEERYVELVSVTVLINAFDVFALAIGTEPVSLPGPTSGTPSQKRPATARSEGAWVPQIPAGEEGGEDWAALYGDREFVPQIGRALSLVPSEVDLLNALSGAHYMAIDHVGDPSYAEPGRSLDRLQMELVASRVSAINECFY